MQKHAPPRLCANCTYRRTLAVRQNLNQNFKISGLCQRTRKSFAAHPCNHRFAAKHLLQATRLALYKVSFANNFSQNQGNKINCILIKQEKTLSSCLGLTIRKRFKMLLINGSAATLTIQVRVFKIAKTIGISNGKSDPESSDLGK